MSTLFISFSFTFFHLLNYLIPKLLVWIRDSNTISFLRLSRSLPFRLIWELQAQILLSNFLRVDLPAPKATSGTAWFWRKIRDAPPESVTLQNFIRDQTNQWASVIKWRCLMGYRTEGPRAPCWIQINRSAVAENPEPKTLESQQIRRTWCSGSRPDGPWVRWTVACTLNHVNGVHRWPTVASSFAHANTTIFSWKCKNVVTFAVLFVAQNLTIFKWSSKHSRCIIMDKSFSFTPYLQGNVYFHCHEYY